MTAQPVGRSFGSRTWLALMPISPDPEFFRQVNVVGASHWPDSLGMVREALGFSPLEPGHVVHLAISETGKSRAPVSHCRKYEFTSASTWASLFLRGGFILDVANLFLTAGPVCPISEKDAGDSGRDGQGGSSRKAIRRGRRLCEAEPWGHRWRQNTEARPRTLWNREYKRHCLLALLELSRNCHRAVTPRFCAPWRPARKAARHSLAGAQFLTADRIPEVVT